MITHTRRPSLHALKLVSALAALASSSVGFAADVYLDLNGVTAGSGATTVNGTAAWNTATANWSTDPTGVSAPQVWTNGDSAFFSAGADATGPTILTNGGVTVDNLTQQEGRVRIDAGTLTLADNAMIVDVQTRVSGDYDLRINSIIADSGAGASAITKTGAGVLHLNGANTFSGGLTMNAGSVFFEANASVFGSGALTLNGGNLIKSWGNAAVNVANTMNVTGTTNVGIINQNAGQIANIAFNGTWTAGETDGVFHVANTNANGFNLASSTVQVAGDISAYTGTFSHNHLGTGGNRLRFGATNSGNATINGANARFFTSGATSGANALDRADGSFGTFRMGELAGTGGVVRGGWSSGGHTTFEVGALNTHAKFGGQIQNNVNGSGGLSILNKVGTGTLELSLAGGNSYTGGTTVTAGALLVSNTSNSGTGAGAVTVGESGTLGGTGIIAPGGANGVSISGLLSPGGAVSATTGGTFSDSVGTLTFNMAGTTGVVTMASGAGLKFELGAAGVSLAAAGAGDLIALTSASAGDWGFNDNTVDFLGTGAEGYYKLFDTSLDSTTWSGLTFDGATGVVSVGLSFTNLVSGLTGTFIVGTASNGGDLGDIYINAFAAIPEPGSYAAILGAASLGAMKLRRRRR